MSLVGRWSVMCLVAAAVAATAAVVDSEPQSTDLRSRLDAALAAAAWDSAVALAEESAQLAEDRHREALYVLLRVHCLRQDRPAATKALAELLDASWWDFRRLRADPDLAWLVQEERAAAMMRQAWSRQYIGMLERETRDAMQMPDMVMAALGVRFGERVADIGAGSGYFTLRLAEAVGDSGRVWALDIRQEMLDHIAQRLRETPLANVELRLVPADDPQLPDSSCDLILMVDTIHYIRDRVSYARKLRQALAPQGRLAIIDFRHDPQAQREFAPPLEQQVPRETLDGEMAAAGLQILMAFDFLPEQYFVVYGSPAPAAD